MKSTHPAGTATHNVYPDGSIRCPWGFHAVLPDAGEHVVLRARAAVPGDQVTRLPIEAVREALRAALREAGVDVIEIDVDVQPQEHDCAEMTADTRDSVTA